MPLVFVDRPPVEHDGAAFCDRANAVLGLLRGADLAGDAHVERSAKRSRDLVRK